MFDNIYSGRKVFVTGNTGFKGSWLTLWLEKLGAVVTGYSIDIPTQPNHIELLKLKCTTITGDILDLEHLSSSILQSEPDIIFHLAAQPLVRKSYIDPVLTFNTNVMGTVHILEATRKSSTVAALVNVTTDKVYENRNNHHPYHEDEKLSGYDPYSASKAASEIITNSYSQAFFNPDTFGAKNHILIASARSGNVIGGGDWAEDRLLPDMMRAATAKQKVSLRYPGSTRPWQHVLEPLSGYILLGAELLKGNKTAASAWNFGPSSDQEMTVLDVVLKSQKLWSDIEYQVTEEVNYHEADRLQINSSKAKSELDWHNVWSSDESLKQTINWYRRYHESGKADSEIQLNNFVTDAKKRKLSWIK